MNALRGCMRKRKWKRRQFLIPKSLKYQINQPSAFSILLQNCSFKSAKKLDLTQGRKYNLNFLNTVTQTYLSMQKDPKSYSLYVHQNNPVTHIILDISLQRIDGAIGKQRPSSNSSFQFSPAVSLNDSD